MRENVKQAGDGLTSIKLYSQEELNVAYEQGKRDERDRIRQRLCEISAIIDAGERSTALTNFIISL